MDKSFEALCRDVRAGGEPGLRALEMLAPMIGELGSAAVDALARAGSGERSGEKFLIAQRLVRLGAALFRELADAHGAESLDSETRNVAIITAAWIRCDDALPHVAEIIERGDEIDAPFAASVLAGCDPARARAAILARLHSPNLSEQTTQALLQWGLKAGLALPTELRDKIAARCQSFGVQVALRDLPAADAHQP